MTHGFIGNQEIHCLSRNAAGSEPLGPLSRLQPITLGDWKLMQTGEMPMEPVKFFAGPGPLKDLKDNRRGDGRSILPNEINDPIANFRNDFRREVTQPSRRVDENESHVSAAHLFQLGM